MSLFFNSSDELGVAQLAALNATLRQMANLGLARVLRQAQRPIACDPATVQLLHRLFQLNDTAASQSAAKRRFDQLFQINTAPNLTLAQMTLVEAARPKTGVARLTARLRAWLHRTLRRPTPLAHDAAHFTHIWAADAFGTYGFQAQTARSLQDDLEGRVLLWPQESRPPRLSPITCWWLASQLEAADITGLSPGHTTRLLVALSEYAETLAQQKGWAGFWDQYLHHRAAQNGLTTPKPLANLPLISHGAQALATDPKSDCAQALPDWRSTAPAYAPALFGGGY